jgi:hypothetical protein
LFSLPIDLLKIRNVRPKYISAQIDPVTKIISASATKRLEALKIIFSGSLFSTPDITEST